MNLIDLRGRQDEPAVRRVLEQSHGSTEALEEACAHYRSGEWTFIGWQEGEEILACAGAEQLTGGTIGIRSIAVAPAWRHRGLGRTLLDSLAGRAGASMVVAETDTMLSASIVVADSPSRMRLRSLAVRATGAFTRSHADPLLVLGRISLAERPHG